MSKNKEQRISYDYQHKGPEEFCNKVTVQAGIAGVLQVHIDVLLEHNHRWYLQERYDNENRDWDHVRRQIEAENVNTDEGYEGCEIADMGPEIHYQAFPEDMDEEPVDPRMEELMKALSQLTQEQRDLIYEVLGANRSLAEIAEEQGVSRQALNNRKNKIITRLRKIMGVEI